MSVFHLFKLHKWYQIAQNITCDWNGGKEYFPYNYFVKNQFVPLIENDTLKQFRIFFQKLITNTQQLFNYDFSACQNKVLFNATLKHIFHLQFINVWKKKSKDSLGVIFKYHLISRKVYMDILSKQHTL